MPDAPDDPLTPIPLVILTGFLGAGKTTRLNRWLTDPLLADTLVIINEFGTVGLDHLLVEEAPGDMILMAAGCLCCTIRGDLVATLEDLLRRRDNDRIRFFRRVLIETTGLADPLPILHSVLQHPYLSKRFRVASLVALVDAANGAAALRDHVEARRQVALADRIILTKTDLAEDTAVTALTGDIAALNRGVIPSRGEVGFAAADLFTNRFEPPGNPGDDLDSWLGVRAGAAAHDPSRHGDIETFTLIAETPVGEPALTVFRSAMQVMHGPAILRMKGIVAVEDDPDRPIVVHQVQSVLHPPRRLERWPGRDRRSRVVVIAQGDIRAEIEGFWNAVVLGKSRIGDDRG